MNTADKPPEDVAQELEVPDREANLLLRRSTFDDLRGIIVLNCERITTLFATRSSKLTRCERTARLKLKPVSWQATFFFYRKPNHTLYSGIARACNEAWRLITRPKGLQFSEPVIRFPAYVAGIASIAKIALLLKELEFPSAGVVAAFLSALLPWHIRYASEARVYAFVLCRLRS